MKDNMITNKEKNTINVISHLETGGIYFGLPCTTSKLLCGRLEHVKQTNPNKFIFGVPRGGMSFSI